MQSFLCIFIITLIVLTLLGCRHPTIYVKDNIKAVGGKKDYQKDNRTFFSIKIGSLDKPYQPFNSSKNPFTIKLSSDRIITSNEMTLKTISSLPNVTNAYHEKMGLTIWSVAPYNFYFNKHILIMFATNHFGDFKPLIRGKHNRKFISFPMTQKQLESIFGKSDKYIDRSDCW